MQSIQEKLLHAGANPSHSAAIQIALLAFDQKTDLTPLVRRNQKHDGRRTKS